MNLLIIGGLDGQIGAASRIAMNNGAGVVHAQALEEGLNALRSGKGVDLVMIDVGEDVRSLVNSLANERIVIPVVACGVAADTRAAVAAIKAGAKEYVPLPPDPELIAAVLQAVTEETNAIVHADGRMTSLLRMAEQVAPSDASVMITGASGTGKEMFAKFLHMKSKRRSERFVAVNCAAIPENLLESELFGHEKGAFTGAVARRLGKFEEANGGTLLLDEISEMDIRLQAKLLRAIQEREIDRVGGNKPVKVDVRILATSNRDMDQAVKDGVFREDLLFRLNVITLSIPNLEERPADIDVLCEHFIEKYSEANGTPARALSNEAKAMLKNHAWPGNVRELENTIHRAVLLSPGDRIEKDAILLTGMEGVRRSGMGGGVEAMVGRTVADVERELIIDTVEHCLGNRTHAANILGISIRTLRNKLRRYSEDGFAIPNPGGEGERPTV